jgi:hypothetical protein
MLADRHRMFVELDISRFALDPLQGDERANEVRLGTLEVAWEVAGVWQ